MANVHDVAAYVLEHFDGASISTMKLQKLVFFAQGWSIGATGTPIFRERFHAWAKGPVCYDLFNLHRGKFSVASWSKGDPSQVHGRDKVIVDAALRNYGGLSGLDLSELTHRRETPWRKARLRAGVPEGASCSEVLDDGDMREYFSRLLSLDSDGQH